MYQVLVVDDEPASLKHICNIIKNRCPDFKVADTARNGQIALQKAEEEQPDVVISDVMMPLMNGIELVSEVKKRWPEILSVIVSGYSDFEYAKGAIQSGVCEYILKPVRPSDIEQLMESLRQRLDELYYEKRNSFLKKASGGTGNTVVQEIRRLFPEDLYYAAIYRKNGLPSRFSKGYSADLYSMPQEKIIIYGRDEMEALYLCPENLLNGESFGDYFAKVYARVKEEGAFYTAVVREEPFQPEGLPGILGELYRKLDESIVIGKDQIVTAGQSAGCPALRPGQEDFSMLEYYVRKKSAHGIEGEIKRLFGKWEAEVRPQVWVEEKIHYLFGHLYSKGNLLEFNEFVLDDIFSEAVSMEEVAKNIQTLLIPGGELKTAGDRRKEEYEEILQYLDEHLSESISAQSICRQFAMSQTTLSKMFHKYGNSPFSVCLTRIRMEKARSIMNENPEILVKDAAERVGYTDQFYFSRVFHSALGISPSEYLEQQSGRSRSLDK
ncbi:response regulator [Murimonas intestini]|uniref:response regulator n=1 Tax=Murimonas intestini TaxID=1337051 RepID=UPI0011DDE1CF|nr:response regulator [Murimonas intestini]